MSHNQLITEKKNNGRYLQYSLVATPNILKYSLNNPLTEDVIWHNDISPLLQDLPENVKRALQYCVTEMINNVLDHSNADVMFIKVDSDALSIRV